MAFFAARCVRAARGASHTFIDITDRCANTEQWHKKELQSSSCAKSTDIPTTVPLLLLLLALVYACC